jgi:hypothetical protein
LQQIGFANLKTPADQFRAGIKRAHDKREVGRNVGRLEMVLRIILNSHF